MLHSSAVMFWISLLSGHELSRGDEKRDINTTIWLDSFVNLRDK